MSLPREYSFANETVFKLKHSIYGLRQAPRAWNKRLTDDMKLSVFQPLINTERVFSRFVDGSVVYLYHHSCGQHFSGRRIGVGTDPI
jgi:hypothetical protein